MFINKDGRFNKLAFLIKFGKKENIESIHEGKFYFNPAEFFRDLEFKQGKYDSNDCKTITSQFGFCEDNAYIPIFCCSECFVENCEIMSDGSYRICFSSKFKETIIDHFDNPDSALIIHQPQLLIEQLDNRYPTYDDGRDEINVGFINYFNLNLADAPYDDSIEETPIQNFLGNYLGEKVASKIDNGKLIHHIPITTQSLYNISNNVPFMKTSFFQNQQEFRIVYRHGKVKKGFSSKLVDAVPATICKTRDLFNDDIKILK